MVRPDGTISLGFYGDLQAAGLNRREIKEKIVGHLGKVLSQEDLGLTRKDPKSGKEVKLAPADADHVFVDENIHYEVAARKRAAGGTGEKLDRILQSLDELQEPETRQQSARLRNRTATGRSRSKARRDRVETRASHSGD